MQSYPFLNLKKIVFDSSRKVWVGLCYKSKRGIGSLVSSVEKGNGSMSARA